MSDQFRDLWMRILGYMDKYLQLPNSELLVRTSLDRVIHRLKSVLFCSGHCASSGRSSLLEVFSSGREC